MRCVDQCVYSTWLYSSKIHNYASMRKRNHALKLHCSGYVVTLHQHSIAIVVFLQITVA